MKNILFIALLLCLNTAVFAYSRIVSLAPSVTESLYELGLDKNIIGITSFCPKGKSKKEIIGTLLESNLEKILSLKPDLVVATKEGNNKAAIEKLMRMGLNVYVMDTSKTFVEICSSYLALADQVGKTKDAKAIIADSKRTVEAIRNKIDYKKTRSVFWEVGAKPLYTAGAKSYANDYNYYTKTSNIYKDINMRYPQIDVEDVVKRNPDIIIIVNMGDVSSQEIDLWNKYLHDKTVFMINVNDIFTPTPQTFAKGLQLIAKRIYPEIFGGK